ncbi:MAG TPA: spore coat U domain-containing protein [Fontimonas sp.]
MDRMQINKAVAVAIGALLGMTAGAALAQTSTDDFQVRITIEKSCQVESAQTTDMEFGTRQLLNTTFEAESAIAVTCTTGVPYTVALNAGSHASGGDTTTRHMAKGSELIAYDLFQDQGRTTHWGTVAGGASLGLTGTGVTQTHPVYGKVPAGQTTPSVGLYTDTITVEVAY